MEYRKIKAEESLRDFAYEIVSEQFKDIMRDNGASYLDDHLIDVSRKVHRVTQYKKYDDVATAAGEFHDSPEDIEGFDVYDPFSAAPTLDPNVTYLNDLVQSRGEEGKLLCKVVDLMTRRTEIYQDYVHRIFRLPSHEPERTAHIIAGVVKMADRNSNIKPNEVFDTTRYIQEYAQLNEDSATFFDFEEFYKRSKTIDAFELRGDYSYDPDLLDKTLLETFEAKKRVTGIDNLMQYLPLAEQ